MPKLPQEVLELTDQMIVGLLGHPTIPTKFAFFSELRDADAHQRKTIAQRKCAKCLNEAKRRMARAILNTKIRIAKLPAAERVAFKTELRAQKLKLQVPRSTGQTMTILI